MSLKKYSLFYNIECQVFLFYLDWLIMINNGAIIMAKNAKDSKTASKPASKPVTKPITKPSTKKK